MVAPAAQNAANPAPTPFEHKLVKFDLEGHFHYTFTVDLELDLTDPKLDKKFDLKDVPIVGKWQCGFRSCDDGSIRVQLWHSFLPAGIWGARSTVLLEVFYFKGVEAERLNSFKWERSPQPALNPKSSRSFSHFYTTIKPEMLTSAAKALKDDLKVHRAYRVTFSIDSGGAEPPKTLLNRLPALELSTPYKGVCLFFPQHEADLWADSSFLTRSSPYFKTLLASEFAEVVTVPSKRARTRRGSSIDIVIVDDDWKDSDDSDDETDELYFKAHSPSQHERDELQRSYKEIKITKTAFTTYRAVLAYLRTGHIAFAPLSSTFSADADAAAPTRASRIKAAVSSDPSLPYPVSPKSTFRLAHLLELGELQHLCLANLSSQLTINCAPYELFSDTSVCYDAWRKIVLDFVVDNCDAVTASDGWNEMMAKLKRNEIEGATPIMVELFERKVLKTA
ncbi:hypothetical protein NBRC10513v2_004529 [Rhodotorula toruloides]